MKKLRNNTVWILSIVLFAAALGSNGCKWTSTPADLHFSEDGTMVAFSLAECWDLPLPPEMPTFRTVPYARWCKMNSPRDCETIKLPSSRSDYGYYIVNDIVPIFSPDSRRLAIISPDGLLLADVESGKYKKISLAQEEVKTARWIENDELGYAAHTTRRGKYDDVIDLTFWRQKIDQPANTRTEIHRELGIDNYPNEYWSPGGKHVIFVYHGYYAGQFRMLDIATGKATELGSPGIMSKGVSWKPDSTAAVIHSQIKGDLPVEVLLVELETGETIDLSERFQETFGNDLPSIDPLWTADGLYLVVNSLELGGCLVRPEPWEVIRLSKRIVERFYTKDNWLDERLPWISRQPAPGWIRVWAPSRKRESLQLAVDYQGKNHFTIGPNSTPGGGWILTPDATRAVRLNKSAKPEVVKVEAP